MSKKTLLIEIASDVICPWCYIGKRRLEKALASLEGEVEARIEWLPFQLNPGMPPEGMDRAAYLEAKFGRAKTKLHPSGGLWVCWPKKTAGRDTNLTEDVVREVALAQGLVDNKVCAIDETWSGLRLVIRKQNR